MDFDKSKKLLLNPYTYLSQTLLRNLLYFVKLDVVI